MNARHERRIRDQDPASNKAPADNDMTNVTVVRHVHHERDYGVGYGNSSGYGYVDHFVDGHVDPLFRCH